MFSQLLKLAAQATFKTKKKGEKNTLAYVSWHSNSSDVTATKYEDLLVEFHKALDLHKPRGFIGSKVFRSQNAPWLRGEPKVYEVGPIAIINK